MAREGNCSRENEAGANRWPCRVCDDAGDFTPHQFLAGARLLHLFANRHAVAAADQTRDVALGRVVGDAAHRDGIAFLFVAGRESDFELARGG